MTVSIEVSEVVERPVSTVFTFYADDHVQNHPRWDPNIELWLDSDEPLDVGMVIQRRNSRFGTPVEGTMEVVEFERDRAFGVLITDGSMQIPARAVFESLGPSTTKLTVSADFPVDDSLEDQLSTGMHRSVTNIKRMVEASGS